LHIQQDVRLYDFCSEFFLSDREYCTFYVGGGGGGGGGGGSWVMVLVAAAAATMISNKISLHVSWDQELHLQHFLLEHKSSSFWHYKVTGGTVLHPYNYF